MSEQLQKGDHVTLNEEGIEKLGEQRRGEVKSPPIEGKVRVQWEGKTAMNFYPVSYLQKITPPIFPLADQRSGFEPTGNDVIIVATNPAELEEGQKSLIISIRAKETAQMEEIKGAEEMIVNAQAAGVSTKAADAMLQRARNRQRYLGKIATALEGGYVMVPNFPGDTIAIRVKRQSPRGRNGEGVSEWSAKNATELEQPERLEPGEGRYVDPRPILDMDVETKTEGDRKVTTHIAVPIALDEEIDLPAEFHKPLVVKRLGAALASKIFDEIVIAPGHRVMAAAQRGTAGDPMVLGRILQDRRQRWSARAKMLTFLIAWFQDTSVI